MSDRACDDDRDSPSCRCLCPSGGVCAPLQEPLIEALKSGQIAGAALDCYAEEPVTAPTGHPLAHLPNVITAPHCIGWTAELFRDIGSTACDALVAMSMGQRPCKGVINPAVFDKPSFQAKWQRVLEAAATP